jgi:hypothetical protein
MAMATAHRAHLDISWQQCHGALSCDLCEPSPDDASAPLPLPAVTPRPSAERPATVTALRLVTADEVFGAELWCY